MFLPPAADNSAMPDPRDMVELSDGRVLGGDGTDPLSAPKPDKRFLTLWFSCANICGRAHKSADGTCYQARCGKCGKTVSFPIGSGGSSRRMFEVSCR